MKVIVNTAPNRLELVELPLPGPEKNQVRIRTAACGICATDLEMIAGWERTGFPAFPGHEWSGIIDSVGAGVDPKWIGQRCVAENVLADGGEVGFEHPGGYAEYFLTEASKIRFLPDTLPFTAATLIEPMAVCVRGLKRLSAEDLSSVVVFGDGPIGLLMTYLLHHHGFGQICLVGGRPKRLKAAGELGADITLNYHELGDDLENYLASLSPSGFPNVIEASGSGSAIQICLNVTARGGKVLIAGEYGKSCADFPWNRILLRELELIGTVASANAWDEAVLLAKEGNIPYSKLISHTVPAAEFERGIELARNSPDAIKVVLVWIDEYAAPQRKK
jgi:threonine dehydrogenase-like Zn-dependent dehydrogenase